ncbi:hypothetical protein BJ742DRAFT_536516 [Cladochytrium replicatum]|nr:hypothetical protein BJ742DRAFT_536516 [Cladochytrium replicatum]
MSQHMKTFKDLTSFNHQFYDNMAIVKIQWRSGRISELLPTFPKFPGYKCSDGSSLTMMVYGNRAAMMARMFYPSLAKTGYLSAFHWFALSQAPSERQQRWVLLSRHRTAVCGSSVFGDAGLDSGHLGFQDFLYVFMDLHVFSFFCPLLFFLISI